MANFNMISALPDQSLKGGIELLNRYQWNISIEERNSEWVVSAGDKLLLKVRSKAEVDTFIYGMALVLALLPPEIAHALERFARDATSQDNV